MEYTLRIFCWMHHGHSTCLPSLLWGDLYTKELGNELSLLHFCKTKNQPGLTITEMGQSQKLSAECLFPSKTWWSGYKETEIQLILVLVSQKKNNLLDFGSERNNSKLQCPWERYERLLKIVQLEGFFPSQSLPQCSASL